MILAWGIANLLVLNFCLSRLGWFGLDLASLSFWCVLKFLA
jgi:hypothetical protein